MANIPQPQHDFVNAANKITPPWYLFLSRLAEELSPGGGAAPSGDEYIVGTADPVNLPNARVATDSPSIDVDLGTAGQIRWHVIADPAGALDGGTLADLAVRVDGVTIDINGSNELEVIGGGHCEPLTNGIVASPELIFALGDVVMVCV
jgi:hypothetical protein